MSFHVETKRSEGFQAEPIASIRPFISRHRSVKAELSLRPTHVPSVPERETYAYRNIGEVIYWIERPKR